MQRHLIACELTLYSRSKRAAISSEALGLRHCVHDNIVRENPPMLDPSLISFSTVASPCSVSGARSGTCGRRSSASPLTWILNEESVEFITRHSSVHDWYRRSRYCSGRKSDLRTNIPSCLKARPSSLGMSNLKVESTAISGMLKSQSRKVRKCGNLRSGNSHSSIQLR
jgi:hypothetical protein